MIRIKVDLEPFGMQINGKQLAEIRIWNSTTKGLTVKHNYEYEMIEPNPLNGPAIIRRGSLKGYDRNQPVFCLVKEVLNDANLEQN